MWRARVVTPGRQTAAQTDFCLKLPAMSAPSRAPCVGLFAIHEKLASLRRFLLRGTSDTAGPTGGVKQGGGLLHIYWVEARSPNRISGSLPLPKSEIENGPGARATNSLVAAAHSKLWGGFRRLPFARQPVFPAGLGPTRKWISRLLQQGSPPPSGA